MSTAAILTVGLVALVLGDMALVRALLRRKRNPGSDADDKGSAADNGHGKTQVTP
jgi:hypothetical protein